MNSLYSNTKYIYLSKDITDINMLIENKFSGYFKKKNITEFNNGELYGIALKTIGYNQELFHNDLCKLIKLYEKKECLNYDKIVEYVCIYHSELTVIHNKYISSMKSISFSGEDYDDIVTLFNYMEELLEDFTKNLFKFYVGMEELGNVDIKKTKASNATFGSLYCEMKKINLNILNDYKISLNQWRNIACHRDYNIKNDKIHCKYGKNNEHTFITNIVELKEEIEKIHMLNHIMTSAFDIFTLDNLEEISKIGIEFKLENPRCEIMEIMLAQKFLAIGFVICDINIYEDYVSIIVMENKEDISKKDRVIHLGQLLVQVHYIGYDKSDYEMICYSKKGKLSGQVSCSKKVIEDSIYHQNTEYLAENTNFSIY